MQCHSSEKRRCSKCREHKTLDCFCNTGMRNGRMRIHSWCKGCLAKAQKAHGKTPEGKATWRRHFFKRRYGITPEQYDQLLKEQGDVCAICSKPEKNVRGGVKFSLAVDHDHLTGKFRGLLCCACNRGLAAFRDNPALLLKAIAYLHDHEG